MRKNTQKTFIIASFKCFTRLFHTWADIVYDSHRLFLTLPIYYTVHTSKSSLFIDIDTNNLNKLLNISHLVTLT